MTDNDSVSIKLAWFDKNDLERLQEYADDNGLSLARAIADKAALGLSGGGVKNVNAGNAQNVVQGGYIDGLTFG